MFLQKGLPQPVTSCWRYLRSTRRRSALFSGSYMETYRGPKQFEQRPMPLPGPLPIRVPARVSPLWLVPSSVLPQRRLRQMRGEGRFFFSCSWFARWTRMSRRRTILLQRWHSVVLPPSISSCGVRFASIASGLGESGSPS